MAQQRQPGLVVQPPQVRQPKPVFQQPSHLSSAVRRRSFYSVFLAASHSSTAAAAAGALLATAVDVSLLRRPFGIYLLLAAASLLLQAKKPGKT